MPIRMEMPDLIFGKTINSYTDKSRQKGRNMLILAPDKYSTTEKSSKIAHSSKWSLHHHQVRSFKWRLLRHQAYGMISLTWMLYNPRLLTRGMSVCPRLLSALLSLPLSESRITRIKGLPGFIFSEQKNCAIEGSSVDYLSALLFRQFSCWVPFSLCSS